MKALTHQPTPQALAIPPKASALLRWVVLIATILCCWLNHSAHAQVSVEGVGMTVTDMTQAMDFYTRVLGFVPESETELAGPETESVDGIFGVRKRVVVLRLGEERLQLTEYLTPKGKPIQVDSQSNDRWFQHIAIVVSDMEKAYQRLRENRVQFVSTGPQRLPEWNRNAAGIEAFYFQDPDHHNLEIIHFPPGKGKDKWHHHQDKLFLGIDHTAIVVENTSKSLHFYRDQLGMKVVGGSLNSGSEQAHLNLVKDAKLKITSLQGISGPGIEFLQYLHPLTGRPYPGDVKPNDIVHWETLVKPQSRTVVNRVTPIRPTALNEGTTQFYLRDPDGHVLKGVTR